MNTQWTTVTTTPEALAAAFKEWDRRVTAHPEDFATAADDPTGGTRAAYLLQMLGKGFP